jgi:hypothetical protein
MSLVSPFNLDDFYGPGDNILIVFSAPTTKGMEGSCLSCVLCAGIRFWIGYSSHDICPNPLSILYPVTGVDKLKPLYSMQVDSQISC